VRWKCPESSTTQLGYYDKIAGNSRDSRRPVKETPGWHPSMQSSPEKSIPAYAQSATRHRKSTRRAGAEDCRFDVTSRKVIYERSFPVTPPKSWRGLTETRATPPARAGSLLPLRDFGLLVRPSAIPDKYRARTIQRSSRSQTRRSRQRP